MERKLPFLTPLKRELAYRLKDRGGDLRETESMARQLAEILERSDPADLAPVARPDRHVLFVTGYGLSPSLLSAEAVLMLALHARGSRVSALYCNAALPACEFNPTGNGRPGAGRYGAGLTRAAALATCRTCVTIPANTWNSSASIVS